VFAKVFIMLVALCISTQAYGFSIDASALSSSATKQAMLNFGHIQRYDNVTLELAGKYVRSEGREAIWGAEANGVYDLSNGFRYDMDNGIYHTHSTYSGALGYGKGPFTVTAGARVEHVGEGPRTVFGKLTGIFKQKWGFKGGIFAVTAKGEWLKSHNDPLRFDYRTAMKFQKGVIYLALRFDEIRKVETQGVSVGISF